MPATDGPSAGPMIRATHVTSRCAERHADADLPGAAGHGVGDDAVHAHGREHQRQRGEPAEQHEIESLGSHRATEQSRQRGQAGDRLGRIDPVDRFLEDTSQPGRVAGPANDDRHAAVRVLAERHVQLRLRPSREPMVSHIADHTDHRGPSNAFRPPTPVARAGSRRGNSAPRGSDSPSPRARRPRGRWRRMSGRRPARRARRSSPRPRP